MTANERIVRNNTICETRGAFDFADSGCGAAIYVLLVVHIRLMSVRYAAAVRGSCQDIWLSLPRRPSDPAPGSRRPSTGFLVSAARLAGSHIIREEGGSSASEIACAARLCTQWGVFAGDAMAEGACLIAQRTAGTEGAKRSMLVLSTPSPIFSFPLPCFVLFVLFVPCRRCSADC
jgi:hypothetical protein